MPTLISSYVLQNNNHNTKAEIVRPFLLTHIDETKLSDDEKRLLDLFKAWNLENNPEEKGPAIFEVWTDSLEKQVWHDEFARAKDPIYPHESTLIDGLLKDSLFQYTDDIHQG